MWFVLFNVFHLPYLQTNANSNDNADIENKPYLYRSNYNLTFILVSSILRDLVTSSPSQDQCFYSEAHFYYFVLNKFYTSSTLVQCNCNVH